MPDPANATRALQLDPADFLPWARGIARGVRADYGFAAGGAEEAELERVAYLAVVEYAHRFDESRFPVGGDLAGAFKGLADVEIRSRCRREAVRLRNGGTFRTTASPAARRMRVESLSNEQCGRALGDLLEARSEGEPVGFAGGEDEDVIECKFQPVLWITNSETGAKRRIL